MATILVTGSAAQAGNDDARRVAVTGATGFIGRALALRLARDGFRVRAPVRSPADEELSRHGIEVVPLAPAAFTDCDVVFHLAGDARLGNGPGYQAANVEVTRLAVEAARANSPALSRFVFVSTLGVMDRAPFDPARRPVTETTKPHPRSDYGRTKLAAETLVRNSGLPWTIVRPAMVCGTDMRINSHVAVFAAAALKGGLLGRLDLPGRMCVLHVDDLVEALVLVAREPRARDRVFLAAGNPMAFGDILEAAAPNGRRIPLRWLAQLFGPVRNLLPFAAKAMIFDAILADDAELRSLGWSPRHSAVDTVREVARRERSRSDGALAPVGWTMVTGAASGLGAALAEQLAGLGRRLILVDRDAEGLAALLRGRADVHRIVCNLADPAAFAVAMAAAPYDRLRIDEAFACAGIGLRGEVAELPVAAQELVLQVNFLARLRLVRMLLPAMLGRHFGRIVLISSSTAFQSMPYMTVYAASNAAVLSLGEGVSGEVAGRGIEIVTVCPGGMATNFQTSAGVRKVEGERLMSPAEAAARIMAMVGRGGGSFALGTRSLAMSLVARMLPRKWSVALWRRLMSGLR